MRLIPLLAVLAATGLVAGCKTIGMTSPQQSARETVQQWSADCSSRHELGSSAYETCMYAMYAEKNAQRQRQMQTSQALLGYGMFMQQQAQPRVLAPVSPGFSCNTQSFGPHTRTHCY